MKKMLLTFLVLAGCLPPPDPEIGHHPLTPKIESSAISQDSDDLYYKTKEVEIKGDSSVLTGSLIDLNSNNSLIVQDMTPKLIGDYITLKISPNSQAGMESTKPESQEDTTSGEGESTDAKSDELSKMLESLPELKPEEKSLQPLKFIKVRVVGKSPNGDLMLAYERSSNNEAETKQISFRAKIPGKLATRKENFSTQDLVDVSWRETAEGNSVVRESVDWQDEYSLRLSGFDEAKSLAAMQLDTKRKTLETMKKSLKDQINLFRKEKNTFASERSELLKKQADQEKQINELSQIVSETKEESIEDKPGDSKDGREGI